MQVSWVPLVKNLFFILCTARSGSTLLRCILNTHSEIYAPHEWNFHYLKVDFGSDHLRRSMKLHGWLAEDLRWMLQDRLYYEGLRDSGKKILVEKTHSNLADWRKIAAIWPGAKFVILFRRPDQTIESFARSFNHTFASARRNLLPKLDSLLAAFEEMDPKRRAKLQYEDLIRNPDKEVKKLCDFLEVEYEPGMLNYETKDIRPFNDGVGDWGKKIRSGKIQG